MRITEEQIQDLVNAVSQARMTYREMAAILNETHSKGWKEVRGSESLPTAPGNYWVIFREGQLGLITGHNADIERGNDFLTRFCTHYQKAEPPLSKPESIKIIQ